MILAPRLRPGDTVAIAAPSGPVRTAGRLRRGVAALRACGFEVIVGPMAAARKPEGRGVRARADELNEFLADPGVQMIIMAIGGYTSNTLLSYVDYDALRRHPKIICGYSDITALLLACHTRAGVVTFHGPTLLPEVAEFSEMMAYTKDHLLRVTGRAAPAGRIPPAGEWTDEFHAWDIDDVQPRATRSGGWRWLCDGHGTGPLVGGNLDTLSVLAGTEFWPDFAGAVVFLETMATDLDIVRRSLAHLELLGVFASPRALLFGRPFRAGAGYPAELAALLRDEFHGRGFPVVADVDLGHTDPMVTLPVGVRATVDSAARCVEIVDAAVC